MKLDTLANIVWGFYSNGNPDADIQDDRIDEATIMQMCKMSAANNIRQQYLYGQRIVPGRRLVQAPPQEREDYFVSPLLSIEDFELTDADEMGMRRADMGEFDLYRLPENNHFENIYMTNGACGGLRTNKITLVRNGEEKFYAGKRYFKSFVFASVVGRGLNTFNVPPCVTSITVETTYDKPDADISLDIAFDTATEVLARVNGQEELSGQDKIILQQALQKREDIK